MINEEKECNHYNRSMLAFVVVVKTLDIENDARKFTGFFIFLAVAFMFYFNFILFYTVNITLFQKNRNRYRVVTTAIIPLVFICLIYLPNITDYGWQDDNYLTARTGGVKDTFDACIILKINRYRNFKQIYSSFSSTTVKGTYTLKGDTIFFNRTTPYHDYEDFQFGIFRNRALYLYGNHYSAYGYLMNIEGEMLEEMSQK